MSRPGNRKVVRLIEWLLMCAVIPYNLVTAAAENSMLLLDTIQQHLHQGNSKCKGKASDARSQDSSSS
jgi:hypothetical protein